MSRKPEPKSDGARPWRTLGSRVVYQHPFLTVREDRVALPSGGETTYCVARPGATGVAVGVLPFLDEATVVMEQQWRYIADRHTWEMPTGGVNPGEAPEAAAQRELMEEVGYRADVLVPLLEFNSSKSVVDETCHLYLGAGLRPERLPPDETESIERYPLPFAEVVAMVERGEILDAMTIIAVLRAARLRDAGRLAALVGR